MGAAGRATRPRNKDVDARDKPGHDDPRPRDHPLILRLNQGHRGCDSWNEREARPAMGRWLFAASMLAVCSFVMGGNAHAQSRKPTAQEVKAIRGCATKNQDDLDAGEQQCLFKLVADPCMGDPGSKSAAKWRTATKSKA